MVLTFLFLLDILVVLTFLFLLDILVVLTFLFLWDILVVLTFLFLWDILSIDASTSASSKLKATKYEQWVSFLMPTQQFFSHVMARTR